MDCALLMRTGFIYSNGDVYDMRRSPTRIIPMLKSKNEDYGRVIVDGTERIYKRKSNLYWDQERSRDQ